MKYINKIITSKEAILKVSRELVSEQGLESLNIRMVAKRCNVSIGSIYNYFPSKTELIAATIENVWQDIFHAGQICKQEMSFQEYVKEIFERMQAGITEYPNFFTTHSMSFANSEKGKAREVMQAYFIHMEEGLLKALKNDTKVRKTAFSPNFTQSSFIEFILGNLISLLVKKEKSCEVLLEIMKRTIYERTY